MDERLIWIASLAGILLVSILRKGWGRLALVLCLYATFMYGFLTKAAQGGFEAGLVVVVVTVNAVAIFLAALWLVSCKAKKKPLAAPALLLVLVLVAFAYMMPLAQNMGLDWQAWLPLLETGEEITVHFIDVGQGDAILIHGKDISVLIDAGPREAGEAVVNYLQSRGIRKLDLVIATHPHEDHIGGLLQVLADLEVKEVLDPGVAHTSQTFEDYLDLIDSKDITFTEARAGMIRDFGGVRLHTLHPTEPNANNLNNASIVTRLSYGSVAFLFPGDAEVGAEQEMLEAGKNLRANVLKAAHHGSSTSTSPDFLRAVNPSYVVMMLSEDNSYGYPHQETRDLFANSRINVFRTDLHGNIVFTTDGKTIEAWATKHLDPAPGEGE